MSAGTEPQATCVPWSGVSSSCEGTESRIQSWERESGRCRDAEGSQVQVRGRVTCPFSSSARGHRTLAAPGAGPVECPAEGSVSC